MRFHMTIYCCFLLISSLTQCINFTSKNHTTEIRKDSAKFELIRNNQKLTLHYADFQDSLYNEINVIKNDKEQIEFLGSFNQDFTISPNTEDILLTQYMSLYIKSKGYKIPVLNRKYNFDNNDNLQITLSKPKLPVTLSKSEIEALHNEINELKKNSSPKDAEQPKDIEELLDQLFLASLTGDKASVDELLNLPKNFYVDGINKDVWNQYVDVINKRQTL